MIQAGCLGLSFQNGQTTRKLRNFPPTTRVTGGSWFPNWGPCPQVGWGQDLYLRCHARSVPEFNMTPLRVCQEILTVQMTIPLNRMLMWWCDHTTPPQKLFAWGVKLLFAVFLSFKWRVFGTKQSAKWWFNTTEQFTISTAYYEDLQTQLCHETGIKEHLHFIQCV